MVSLVSDSLCSLGTAVQIDHNGFKAALGASNRLNTGINPANAWGAETILTCVLVFVVFAATDTQRSATSGHLSVRNLGSTDCAAIAPVLMLLIL